jgi:phosphoserine phosphatase RsbU/P
MTQSLLDIAPCGYISFKDDGELIWINDTLCKWLKFSKDELIGGHVHRIFTIASRIFYNTHFYPLLKLHAKADEIFLSLATSDNQELPVVTNAERRLENGRHMNHCVFMPVHQRTRYEEEILKAKREAEAAVNENKHLQELKQSLETKTLELDHHFQKQVLINQNLLQFSKIISHDLQEPLHKIHLFADIILHANADNLSEKSIASLKKIQSAAERLRVLTNGLQQYVNVETEKLFTEVNLNEVVDTAVTKAKKVRDFDDFETIFDTLPVIHGYKNQLELLFFHLFDNSIQFRHPSRKLRIEIAVVSVEENIYKVDKEKYKYIEHVKIRFTDNGIGIDERYKTYVFELLKKIDFKSAGLGIGLPLIKKIIDNHLGTLTINSEEDKGTEIILTIPVEMRTTEKT